MRKKKVLYYSYLNTYQTSRPVPYLKEIKESCDSCYPAGNQLILQDMKRTMMILPNAFGLLLLIACGGPNSQKEKSEPAGEPKPQTSLEWANHGTRLLNKGLPKQALASYDRALLLDTTNPYTYCSKASAYHKLGQPELALENADKALQVDPGYAPAMANKSRALRKLGREAEADSLLHKLKQLSPVSQK